MNPVMLISFLCVMFLPNKPRTRSLSVISIKIVKDADTTPKSVDRPVVTTQLGECGNVVQLSVVVIK